MKTEKAVRALYGSKKDGRDVVEIDIPALK
jgi:hypothetical protein